jgi:MFS family permease
MRLGREDAVSAILVALIGGSYIAFLAAGNVPERGMALIGLVLGALGYLASSQRIPRSDRWRRLGRVGALISLGLGLATLMTGFGGVLAAFVVSIIVLWALVILRNAGVLPGTRAQQAEPPDSDDQRPPPPEPPWGLWRW